MTAPAHVSYSEVLVSGASSGTRTVSPSAGDTMYSAVVPATSLRTYLTTDDNGNTWQQAATVNAFNEHVEVEYAFNVNSGSTIVTSTQNTGTGTWAFGVGIISGADTADPLDTTSSLVESSDTATHHASADATVIDTSADVYVLVVGHYHADTGAGTPGTGYTELSDGPVGGARYYIQYKTSDAALTNERGTWTTTGTNRKAGSVIVAFKAAGSSAVDITVQDATHGHTADQPDVTQTHEIATADSLHSHATDQPTINQTQAIVVQEAVHDHTADNVTVSQVVPISASEALHGHVADSPAVSQTHVISVDESIHSHAADNVTLSQAHSITVDESLHGHTADNVAVSVGGLLVTVQEAAHSHTADQPGITQTQVIVVQESLHAHAAGGVTVTIVGLAPTVPGLEYALDGERLQYAADDERLHYQVREP